MQSWRLLLFIIKSKKMAKRKSKKAKGRRRVGAAKLNANNPIVKLGSIALGFFLSEKINAPIVKAVGTKLDGKIIGAAEAGVGAWLVFGKGKKTMVKAVAGGVLLGAGVKKAMTEFGIGSFGPYGRVPVVAGAYGRVPVLAGYSPNSTLNGYNTNQTLNGKAKVMAGVTPGSGSGHSAAPGSNMMN